MDQVKIRLGPNGKVPNSGSEENAGYDIYSAQAVEIRPGQTVKVCTDLYMAIPKGYYGKLESRSGMASKGVITVGGVIDSNYRGEIGVCLLNTSDKVYNVEKGDRITQMIFHVSLKPEMKVVDSLDETDRGAGGFGSSGK